MSMFDFNSTNFSLSRRDLQRQPVYSSLLDRLTCGVEEHTDRNRSHSAFADGSRHQALRDVSYLLNAKAFHLASSLSSYPLLQKAVVNLGLPNFAGKTRSQLDEDQIAQIIRSTLQRFEPRLESGSLKVMLLAPSGVNPSTFLSFLIEGFWRSFPYPEHLRLRTDLNLETGQFEMHHHSSLP